MATIIYNTNGSITVSVTIPLDGSMMEMENTILDAVNDVGCIATGKHLNALIQMAAPLFGKG